MWKRRSNRFLLDVYKRQPLDYDPDVSFANIENRLQMLVMNAKQEILEENEERDRRRSHHYMESDKKTYRRKKYGCLLYTSWISQME